MRDTHKLMILAAISLVFAFLFIGIGLNADNYEYFLSRRVPKVVAMVLAGIAIGQAAMVFQTITANRILTPSIMGFDSLYLLTQVLVVFIFGGLSSFAINAYWNFTLSTAVMLLFSFVLFVFYFRKQGRNIMTLLLLGVILGQLFYNAATLLIVMLDPNEFSTVQDKMFASFNNINVDLVYLCSPVLLVCCYLLYRLNRILDVFWLDKDNATSLGVDVERISLYVMLLSSVLIAISTALIGPIMFFGLLVTNLTREWLRTYQHKFLLIGVSLLSIATLLVGQWIVENLFQFSTTLSVIINFAGGLYFLWMLMKNRIT